MGRTVKGIITVRYAAEDGRPGEGVTIILTSVMYATSSSGTEKPSAEAWSSSVPSVAEGMWLWTWTRVVYSDGTETNSYSVARSGIDGKGIQSSSVTYSLQEKSVQPESIKTWGDFPSTLTDGWWLYTRTELVYSDGAKSVSYSVSQVGAGSYYAGTEEYYAIGASKSTPPSGYPDPGLYVEGQTVSPGSAWSNSRPNPTAQQPYIWNFEVSADSRGNRYVTEPICIGNFSLGISSFVETYAISAQATKPSGRDYPSDIAEADWKDESHAVPPTDSRPYMWNKTEMAYNDGSKQYSYHVCAVKGADGKGAAYIDLDNEHGSLLLDGLGNVISDACRSNIRFYVNGEDRTEDVVFAKEFESASIGAKLEGNVLTVGWCSASGYAIISCTYAGVKYYARFTVTMIEGTDKYDLSVSPSAVSHNATTGSIAPSSVKVEVYRTSQNGMKTLLGSLPDGYKLMLYADDSASGESLTYASSSASFSVASSVSRYHVVLRDDMGTLLDSETIPVLHVKNGDNGSDGMSLYCQCSTLSVSTDSGGKPLASKSHSIDVYWLKGGAQVSDSTITRIGINGVQYTASGTYGGISFSFSGKYITLGFATSRSISDTVFDVYAYSKSCGIEKPCKISVSVARQGAQGVQGITGAMMRNRGTFTESQLKATSEELYSNDSYIDFIRYKQSDGTYSYYRLKDGIQRWTKAGYYTKAAPSTLVSDSAPYLPSASSSVWTKFDYRDSSAFSFLISSRADIDTATMCQAFIGDQGAVDNGDGTISVSDANGWAISNGQMRHTKTGLTLTADGHLYDPNGLHLKVGSSEASALPSSALNTPGSNLFADPVLQDKEHFGTATRMAEGKWRIAAKGSFINANGTSSAYGMWSETTGYDSSTLNYMSPWRADGGHVISLHVVNGTCASNREMFLQQYPKNRAEILTSTNTQANVYTFSVWFKIADLSYIYGVMAGLYVFRDKVKSDCVANYMSKSGSLSVGSGKAVVVLGKGVMDGTDGWRQYYATFKVMSGEDVTTGSGTFGAKAWIDWIPVFQPARTNFYAAYAGAKLEQGSVPTAMSCATQSVRNKLLDTGIDIDRRSIVCTADAWECRNLSGSRTAWLDDTGIFTANGVFNNLVNVIDWNKGVGRDKLIVMYMDGENPIAYLGNDNAVYDMEGEATSKDDLVWDSVNVYLDVLRLGDVVRIVSLPLDAVGTSGDGSVSVLLPYFVHDGSIGDPLYERTYTRFNAASDSVPRLIKADEMRMLGGRRIVLHSSADAQYTFLRDHRVSFVTSYMAAEDQIANGVFECRYPVGNYELGSGCSLSGDKIITVECRRAYFYDIDNQSKPSQNRSGYGYVWVGMQNESLSSYGETGLDTWT